MYKSHSLSELDPKTSGGKWRPLKPIPVRNGFTKCGSVTPIDIDVETIDDGESHIGNGFIDIGQQQFIEDLLVDKINLKRDLKGLQARLSDAVKGQPKAILGGQFKLRESASSTVQTDEALRAALKIKQKMIKDICRERDAIQQGLSNAKSDATQLMSANADMQAEMDKLHSKLMRLGEQLDSSESQLAASTQTEKTLRTTLREYQTRMSEMEEYQTRMRKMEEEREIEKAKYGELVAREERQRFDHERALQHVAEERTHTEARHHTNLSELTAGRTGEIRACVRDACTRMIRVSCTSHFSIVRYAFAAWRLVFADEKRARETESAMAARKRERLTEKEAAQRREEAMASARVERQELEAQCAKRLEQMRSSWAQEVRTLRSACSKEIQALKEEHRRPMALDVRADAAVPNSETREEHAELVQKARQLKNEDLIRKEQMDTLRGEHQEITRQLGVAKAEVEARTDELQALEKENLKHRSRYAELTECYAEREPKDVRIKREQTLLREIKQLRTELEESKQVQVSPKGGNSKDPGRFRAPPRRDGPDRIVSPVKR